MDRTLSSLPAGCSPPQSLFFFPRHKGKEARHFCGAFEWKSHIPFGITMVIGLAHPLGLCDDLKKTWFIDEGSNLDDSETLESRCTK